jgi:hypothetical protein
MTEKIRSLSEATDMAGKLWNLSFKEKTPDEACSPCPFCGGEDRFLVFHTGYYMCRPAPGHCGKTGWVLNDFLDSVGQRLTAIEMAQLKKDAEEANKKREIEKLKERVTALEKMSHCHDHLEYHRNVDMARDYWHTEGLNDESIKRWMLGYCSRCPMDSKKRPSYTVPVTYNGILRNIRHRIVLAEGHDKYRPHMKGLGNTLFNADALFKEDTSMVILWEGEKKAMVNAQHGFNGPAVMGVQGFNPDWAKWFYRFGVVYVCYDPDALDNAARDAALFNGKGRVVELPMKADDIWGIGMTEGEMCEFLRKARRV